MMPTKKRRTKKIVLIVAIVIIAAMAYILLYVNTNMFKSEQVLFKKYMGNETKQLESFYRKIGNEEYKNKLEESKYTQNKQIKVNYTENLGTSLENTKNSINKLKLVIDGQIDKKDNYEYQDVKLLHNNKEVLEAEYVKDENDIGIRFTDLYNQFTTTEMGKVKETLKVFEMSEEQSKKIPEVIDFDVNYKSKIMFTEEEKKKTTEKYGDLLVQNVSKDKFTKQVKSHVTINGKNVQANIYMMTLPKEEMNRIYVKILENMKDDEIILSKLESIDEKTKAKYVRDLEKKIDFINKNNVGMEEYKILVYENEGKTIKVEFMGNDYLISIENLITKTNAFAKMTIKKGEKEKNFIIEKENEKTKINVENKESENTTTLKIEEKSKIDNEKCDQSFFINIEDKESKIEATVEKSYQIVTDFENKMQLNDENRIKLNTLEEEQVKSLVEQIAKGVTDKCQKLSDKIKIEEIRVALEKMGLIEKQIIVSDGVSNTEKRRFNAHFELLQGNDLDYSDIKIRLDSINEYFTEVKEEETKIRIKLDKNNKEEMDSEKLSSILEKNKNKKMNFEIEYDKETGLASYIVLSETEKLQ